ncbi:hypothetical protein E2C01_041622 [Portunus trituberculatus]|uniref:Uncharacterized protein n=1 Tax=Portunus trituberculatus TaxID=210409 RepID=A0A5B7FS71_PORTR|nr:hypothetical protein [Portunus trituberculatus]
MLVLPQIALSVHTSKPYLFLLTAPPTSVTTPTSHPTPTPKHQNSTKSHSFHAVTKYKHFLHRHHAMCNLSDMLKITCSPFHLHPRIFSLSLLAEPPSSIRHPTTMPKHQNTP